MVHVLKNADLFVTFRERPTCTVSNCKCALPLSNVRGLGLFAQDSLRMSGRACTDLLQSRRQGNIQYELQYLRSTTSLKVIRQPLRVESDHCAVSHVVHDFHGEETEGASRLSRLMVGIVKGGMDCTDDLLQTRDHCVGRQAPPRGSFLPWSRTSSSLLPTTYPFHRTPRRRWIHQSAVSRSANNGPRRVKGCCTPLSMSGQSKVAWIVCSHDLVSSTSGPRHGQETRLAPFALNR